MGRGTQACHWRGHPSNPSHPCPLCLPVATHANTPKAAASAAAEQAASFVGLNKGTGGESQSVHSHAEEHHRPTLPPDAKAEDVQNMDEEGLAAFEEEGVRHAVLVKINKLAM